MKALLMKPYEAAELVDTEDIEETLGGEVEYLWPFEEQEICMAVLADREDLVPNRDFESCGTIRGPILIVGCHDDFDDLTEEKAMRIEMRATFSEEEYDLDETIDPYDDDAQEEEDYCGTRIVDEDEFYESISGNYL